MNIKVKAALNVLFRIIITILCMLPGILSIIYENILILFIYVAITIILFLYFMWEVEVEELTKKENKKDKK